MSGADELDAVQRLLHRLLRGEATPGDAAARLGAPERRVALYADFVRAHIVDVLAKNFACLAGVLPAITWRTLAGRYFAEAPAREYELNHAVAGFPGYVAGLAERGELGLRAVHAELAALEWLEFAVYVATARIPAPDTLTAPTLNPTLALIELTHPLVGVLAAFRAGTLEAGADGARLPAPSPQAVFAVRHPRTARALLHVADDARLFAFKVAHDAMSVAAACEASGLPDGTVRAILANAAEDGIILLPAP